MSQTYSLAFLFWLVITMFLLIAITLFLRWIRRITLHHISCCTFLLIFAFINAISFAFLRNYHGSKFVNWWMIYLVLNWFNLDYVEIVSSFDFYITWIGSVLHSVSVTGSHFSSCIFSHFSSKTGELHFSS